MKSFHPIIFMLIVSCVAGLATSCEKFVDIPLPNSQLTGTTVFKDLSTADAATVALYTRLRGDVLVHGDNSGLSALLGHYADELANYYTGATAAPFYANSLMTTDFAVSNIWQSSYGLIYATNALIEGLDASLNITAEDKVRLTSEALFVRAFVHFYLVNLFGPIPYVKATDYRANATVTRMDSASVYQAILGDLLAAEAKLPVAYPSVERVRPNKAVATAFLSRVYLYAGDWAAAAASATSIISDSAVYGWVNNLDSVFLKSSTGTIWQFKPHQAGQNTSEAFTFVLSSGPPSTALSSTLYGAFEPNDQRRARWLGSVSSGADTWYFPYKYKEVTNTGTSKEYSILLRLEEQYLIRAEVRGRLNDIAGAQADLNRIRHRAGLASSSAETTEELLAAVLSERQRELFTEHGHRWFDLKRMGQAEQMLSGVKPNFDAKDLLFPIPQSELILNPQLAPQNPGYF